MDIFNLFRTKDQRVVLQEKYDRLMEKAYRLEQTNIKAAENVRRKAEQVLHELMVLRGGVTN